MIFGNPLAWMQVKFNGGNALILWNKKRSLPSFPDEIILSIVRHMDIISVVQFLKAFPNYRRLAVSIEFGMNSHVYCNDDTFFDNNLKGLLRTICINTYLLFPHDQPIKLVAFEKIQVDGNFIFDPEKIERFLSHWLDPLTFVSVETGLYSPGTMRIQRLCDRAGAKCRVGQYSREGRFEFFNGPYDFRLPDPLPVVCGMAFADTSRVELDNVKSVENIYLRFAELVRITFRTDLEEERPVLRNIELPPYCVVIVQYAGRLPIIDNITFRTTWRDHIEERPEIPGGFEHNKRTAYLAWLDTHHGNTEHNAVFVLQNLESITGSYDGFEFPNQKYRELDDGRENPQMDMSFTTGLCSLYLNGVPDWVVELCDFSSVRHFCWLKDNFIGPQLSKPIEADRLERLMIEAHVPFKLPTVHSTWLQNLQVQGTVPVDGLDDMVLNFPYLLSLEVMYRQTWYSVEGTSIPIKISSDTLMCAQSTLETIHFDGNVELDFIECRDLNFAQLKYAYLDFNTTAKLEKRGKNLYVQCFEKCQYLEELVVRIDKKPTGESSGVSLTVDVDHLPYRFTCGIDDFENVYVEEDASDSETEEGDGSDSVSTSDGSGDDSGEDSDDDESGLESFSSLTSEEITQMRYICN